MTREQAAVFVYRYVTQYLDQEAEAGADLSDFTDGSRVSAFALEALSWANGQELMQGYGDGYIGPKDTVTRAQMAKLLTVLAERF